MKTIITALFLSFTLVSMTHAGGLSDLLNSDVLSKGKELLNKVESGTGGSLGGDLDPATVANGLKEALQKGAEKAVSLAGIQDGYFKNPEIKIPLPESTQKVTKTLKKLGLGKYIDRFDESINRAAEKAAPVAIDYFTTALKGMSIEDAYKILRGPDNAATQYFKDKTISKLTSAFRPSIDASLSKVGAVKAYKKVQERAGKVGLGSQVDFDMSDYVTGKALDGLFQLVANEEKNIRENPVARTSELLQQVFK